MADLIEHTSGRSADQPAPQWRREHGPMAQPKQGRIVLVRAWSATWHADDKDPSGRAMCGWAHEDDDRPQAPWTVVVERPNRRDQSAHAMCDDCLARAIELYGEPEVWRRS